MNNDDVIKRSRTWLNSFSDVTSLLSFFRDFGTFAFGIPGVCLAGKRGQTSTVKAPRTETPPPAADGTGTRAGPAQLPSGSAAFLPCGNVDASGSSLRTPESNGSVWEELPESSAEEQVSLMDLLVRVCERAAGA